MTTAVMEVPAYVREFAAGVANDIRTNGHYQGHGPRYAVGHPDFPCCVIASPTYAKAQRRADAALSSRMRNGFAVPLVPTAWTLTYRLAQALGLSHLGDALVVWSDNTPTADVLAALDRVATSTEGNISS